jgi:hypothetical protein
MIFCECIPESKNYKMLYKKIVSSLLIILIWAVLIFLISRNSQSVIDPVYVWVVITQWVAIFGGVLLLILRLVKIINAFSFLYILAALLNLSVWIFFLVDALHPGRQYSFWLNFFPTIIVSIVTVGDILMAMTRKQLR